ncbi:TVP38/TMEM64 family protein [Clostridium folliculivorans]|uniref:TVP38/TMEM64 family membrane protein n=1 Tax=Clostridium folliculivorans TaxID=2886038 RepID=A0A9W5Y2Z0_9CLOT|nr:TVP38/TMEM64 family protein [Clostridium folliculivorans]GKU25661.1 TVP38/TMEM64 family protein [Clostridium folliculivorans]GKU28683.1 TVP38/TMEM64 family protein [Clostridium folliculivorans]
MNKLISSWKKNKGIILLILSILVLILLFIIFKRDIHNMIEILKNNEKFKRYLLSFGPLAPIVYTLLQFLQVVIFFIPGEVFQTAGGYVFGTIEATILSIVGINLGSIILFNLTKKYGTRFVEKVVPDVAIKPFESLMNSDRLNLVVFLIYILPGIPKDSSIFLCGLSRITLIDFLIYSTLGRLPMLILSSYYGANIAIGNKIVFYTGTTIFIMLIVIGLVFKDKLFKRLEKVG